MTIKVCEKTFKQKLEKAGTAVGWSLWFIVVGGLIYAGVHGMMYDMPEFGFLGIFFAIFVTIIVGICSGAFVIANERLHIFGWKPRKECGEM